MLFFVGVLKLSGSGKAVLVVLDSGDVFSVARSSVVGLLAGEKRFGSLVLTRLPYRVEPGRFPVSPLFVPGGGDVYSHGVDPMAPKKDKDDGIVGDVDLRLMDNV